MSNQRNLSVIPLIEAEGASFATHLKDTAVAMMKAQREQVQDDLRICWYCDCRFADEENVCPECGNHRDCDPMIDAENLMDSRREDGE